MFYRTVCDCRFCKAPCRAMPGCLVPGDLDRIVEHVNPEDPQAWIASHFLASEGALVMDRMTKRTFRVPTIVPASKTDGSCVFFTEDERCEIHSVAPSGCRLCDMHMNKERGDAVSYYLLAKQIDSHQKGGAYALTCKHLSDSGLTATPLAERRAKLDVILSQV